jgi:hypothetical protein
MPRRKWIPNHLPYAKGPAASLWWYHSGSWPGTARPHDPVLDAYIRKNFKNVDQSARVGRVVDAYIKQVSRGKPVGNNFKDELLAWIYEVAEPVQISPRRKRYWTLPAYARSHGLHDKTFCKRFREMEKIAKRLFPEKAPPEYEKPTEELKRRIWNRYFQLKWSFKVPARSDEEWIAEARHKVAVAKLISKFPKIPAFRIGQICREARKVKRFTRLTKSKDGHYRFPRPL